MKKRTFLLLLLCFCVFAGCGKAGQPENRSETTAMTPSGFEQSLPQVTVSNGRESITPAKVFVCATVWSGEGFVRMDGNGMVGFDDTFEQLAPSLPGLSLGDGISLSHGGEAVSHNSEREKLEGLALSDANSLAPGL